MDKINQPFYSIIVPTYNVEEYIAQCIESVLNQSYRSLELILIDDESTDRTYEICSYFRRRDKRVRLFKLEHGGQARARNKGIDESSGEYVTFLDSDDFWNLNHLERHHKCLNDCDMCIANSQGLFYDKTVKFLKLFPFSEEINNMSLKQQKEFVFSLNNLLPGATVLTSYKKKFLNNKKIRFDEKLSCSEDLNFFLDAILYAESIQFYGQDFYYYRCDNRNSTLHTMDSKKITDRVEVYKKWFDYYSLSKNEKKYIIDKLARDFNVVFWDVYQMARKNKGFKKNVARFKELEYIYNSQKKSFKGYYFERYLLFPLKYWYHQLKG